MGGRLRRPTLAERRAARTMAGCGVPHKHIARTLAIDAKTLRKHFRQELDLGMAEANLKVATTLFDIATVDKDVGALIFILKARAGWREKGHPPLVSGSLELGRAMRALLEAGSADDPLGMCCASI